MHQTAFKHGDLTVTVSWEGRPSEEAIRVAARILVDKAEEQHREEAAG